MKYHHICGLCGGFDRRQGCLRYRVLFILIYFIMNNPDTQNWILEPVPPGVYLEITRRCNLACIYCYARAEREGKDFLDTEQVKGIIDDLGDLGCTFLILSGGEPLVRKDIWEILDYAREVFPVSLITNAVLIDLDTARRLASYPGLSVRVSLDGPGAEYHDPGRGKGSFQKALTGVKNLLKAGMRKSLSLCMTVTRQNVEAVEAMGNLTLALGIPSLVITPVARIGAAEKIWEEVGIPREILRDMFEKLYDFHQKHRERLTISGCLKTSLAKSLDNPTFTVRCPVGQRIAVDYRGEVYPCSLMMSPEFSCGNMLRDPLKEILTGERMKKYMDTALNRRLLSEKCSPCKWRDNCTGGCMARAYMETGSLLSPDPDCGVIGEILGSMDT